MTDNIGSVEISLTKILISRQGVDFIVISNKSDTLWIDETPILSGIDILNLNLN